MAGAWAAGHVKKTYFADDRNASEVSPEMARALGEAVVNPLRESLGLPKAGAQGRDIGP